MPGFIIFDIYFQTTTLIGLLKTVRLLRLIRVVHKFDKLSEYGAAVLLFMMATFALVAHWMACIWYVVGSADHKTTLGSQIGWLAVLSKDTMQNFVNGTGGPSIESRYITALYFTFSSLTSVGYGNVAAGTNPEKLFCICTMIVGCKCIFKIIGFIKCIYTVIGYKCICTMIFGYKCIYTI